MPTSFKLGDRTCGTSVANLGSQQLVPGTRVRYTGTFSRSLEGAEGVVRHVLGSHVTVLWDDEDLRPWSVFSHDLTEVEDGNYWRDRAWRVEGELKEVRNRLNSEQARRKAAERRIDTLSRLEEALAPEAAGRQALDDLIAALQRIRSRRDAL